MRVLCVSAPLAGHLDWGGYLATARELHNRGHTVAWASGARVRRQVEQAGLAFIELKETGWRQRLPPPLTQPNHMDPAARQSARRLRALDQWLDVRRVAAAVEELDAVIAAFGPDVILGEMFMAGAAIAAEKADCPFIVAGWPAPSESAAAVPIEPDSPLAAACARVDDLLTRFAVTGRNWTRHGPPMLCSPRLHLSYWSPGWFAGVAQGGQTRHVGGVATPAKVPPEAWPVPYAAPWIFITLGTTFNYDPNFFITAIRAAVQAGGQPILALGRDANSRLRQALGDGLLAACVVTETADFAATLPYCAAAIHHGGAGTTHALVVHGTPQIVVPHAGDQMRQAQGVARTGCGYAIAPNQATLANLSNALTNLLMKQSPLREEAAVLQQEFAELGGVPRAADEIEREFKR